MLKQSIYVLLMYALCNVQQLSANQTTDTHGAMGQLELMSRSGLQAPAVLLSTNIHGNVNGMVASVSIEQSFSNQTQDWVNGRYVFPLPPHAAVSGLTIRIGERVIVGEVQEKVQAQRTYQQAQRQGKKAGLLEQHRSNLFAVNIANIGPGETVTAELNYLDQVQFNDQVFSLRLPTTLTPRYIAGRPFAGQPFAGQPFAGQPFAGRPFAGRPIAERSATVTDNKEVNENDRQPQTQIIDPATGWGLATHSVPDAAAITPPQTYPQPQQTTHQFELRLLVNVGLPVEQISSNTHHLNNTHLADQVIEVSLAQGHALLNRDLELNWQVAPGANAQAALFQQQVHNAQDEFYSMVMLVPPAAEQQPLPREVTFIIDSSGSMGGTSMLQAQRSLQLSLAHLSVNDRFNIIDFDSSFDALFNQPRYASANNLALANRMIAALQADGGTEMFGALNFALSQPREAEYLQQIIFITDGSIGNEAELFRLIDRQLGNARLFTVAIGSAPNNYFMRKAAKFGRGFSLHISDVSQVNEQVLKLSEKITRPLLRDIQLNWSQPVEQYPQRIPDLYAGEPLVVIAKSKTAVQQVSGSGKLKNQAWLQTIAQQSATDHNGLVAHSPTIELPQPPAAEARAKDKSGEDIGVNGTQALNTLWARAKIEHLMDTLVTYPERLDQVKKSIIELGIKHRLVSKFTSFIAVEQVVSKPDEVSAKPKNIPNLMPQGSTMAAPQTATAAALLQLIGCLLLLLSLCWRYGSRWVTRCRWPAEIDGAA